MWTWSRRKNNRKNDATYHVIFDDVKVMYISGSLWIQVGQHGRHSTQNKSKEQANSSKHSKYGKPFLVYGFTVQISVAKKRIFC